MGGSKQLSADKKTSSGYWTSTAGNQFCSSKKHTSWLNERFISNKYFLFELEKKLPKNRYKSTRSHQKWYRRKTEKWLRLPPQRILSENPTRKNVERKINHYIIMLVSPRLLFIDPSFLFRQESDEVSSVPYVLWLFTHCNHVSLNMFHSNQYIKPHTCIRTQFSMRTHL